ncbi:MAG TPA: pyridoxal-phosphate dependent enzyme [Candidatus Saccharimonadales bacterium]|nr:pyridoxal-phosphate dependent enzyme [Candidatus Saccharimonadales bacterium]
MTSTLEAKVNIGDEAFRIIDDNRDVLGGELQIEDLEVEFPYLSMELAHEFGARGLFLARADENAAGTFKLRGAYVGTYKQKERGVTRRRLHSAGNFASGAAYAGALLDMETHIYVPRSAPFEKREGLYRFGKRPLINIYSVGTTLQHAHNEMNLHPEHGEPFHPFNDPDVIAGQGTIADDLIHALPNVDHIVVPVGGGGLLAGMRQRLDELGKQDVILHGVEAEGSNSMSLSLKAGSVSSADRPNIRYGGSAVERVGDQTLRICMNACNRVQLWSVTDDEVDTVMSSYQQSRDILERLRIPAYEPTTLVAIAGLRHIAQHYSDDTIAVIGTGHNAPLPTYT